MSQRRAAFPDCPPPLSAYVNRPRLGARRNSRRTSSRLQPAKQVTRIPRLPWRRERLGVSSAWAGQRHIAVRPCQVPPRDPTRSTSSCDGVRAIRAIARSFRHALSPLPPWSGRLFSSASDGAIRPCVCGSVPLKNLSRKTPKRSAGASIIHDSKIRGHLAHWNQGYRPSPYEWPGASACAIGGHCASRRGHQREDSADYVSDRGRFAILRKKMA